MQSKHPIISLVIIRSFFQRVREKVGNDTQRVLNVNAAGLGKRSLTTSATREYKEA